MKTLAYITLLLLLPAITFSQGFNVPSVCLKTLDGKSVPSTDVIPSDELTLIYFFNEFSTTLTDNFEYLENLAEKYSETDKINVIAIYDASLGAYGQLKPFLDGSSIELKTYVDVNGEFLKAMGQSYNSSYLLVGTRDNSLTRYFDSIANSYDILDEQFAEVTSLDISGSLFVE